MEPHEVDAYSSVEVRWFGRGEVPALLAAWYGRGQGEIEIQPPRVDHYLPRSGTGLGIKLRAGLVEMKQMQGSYGALTLGESTVGHVERWRKWSFPLLDAGALASSWQPVRKERLMRRYALVEQQHLLPLPLTEPATLACDWELTRLRLGDPGETWWTIGFEALGEPTGLRRLLLQVVGLVLAHDPAPGLTIDASLSYPAWLHTHTAAEPQT